MEGAEKFRMFEKLLEDASKNWLFQEAIRSSSLKDVRYIFQSLDLDDLRRCLRISLEKEQYELCQHLKVLIEERQSNMSN